MGGGGGGGLTARIMDRFRNAICAVSVFSREFSWGLDNRHEFIPNESLDPCVGLVYEGF